MEKKVLEILALIGLLTIAFVPIFLLPKTIVIGFFTLTGAASAGLGLVIIFVWAIKD